MYLSWFRYQPSLSLSRLPKILLNSALGLALIFPVSGTASEVDKIPIVFHQFKSTLLDDIISAKYITRTFKSELASDDRFEILEVSTLPLYTSKIISVKTAAAWGRQANVPLVILGSVTKTGPFIKMTFGFYDVENEKLLQEISTNLTGHDSTDFKEPVRRAAAVLKGEVTPKYKIPAPVIWGAIAGLSCIVGYTVALIVVSNRDASEEFTNITGNW